MQQRQLRLGDILDDYCPRERRVTNHAVVAMVGDDVKQTRCTTCDAEHEYKQAKVPRQRRKSDAPAALYAQVLASGPKRVVPESAGRPSRRARRRRDDRGRGAIADGRGSPSAAEPPERGETRTTARTARSRDESRKVRSIGRSSARRCRDPKGSRRRSARRPSSRSGSRGGRAEPLPSAPRGQRRPAAVPRQSRSATSAAARARRQRRARAAAGPRQAAQRARARQRPGGRKRSK